MIRIIFAFILFIHGLIHLMGFVKAFKLAEIEQLAQYISKPSGLLWMFSALLFIIAVAVFSFQRDWWWMVAMPAILLSQLLIIIYWQDARFGTIANAVVLVVAVVGYGTWSFNTMARNELRSFFASVTSERQVVTIEMLTKLPPVVQMWLQRSNIVGKEMVQTVHLKQSGEMRTTPDGKWMPVVAEQWFRTEKPDFMWLANVTAAPAIHIAGRDKYENGKGHMLIKLLSLFSLADAAGKEIDQGSMLRYLAEIVWFPSAALNNYLQWEQVDSTTAKGTMTYSGVAASGFYKFDVNGNVVSFEAKRYYDRKGGPTLEDWFIQIEPNGYKEFEGVKIPAKSTVTWKLKEGNFSWYKLEIKDIYYNKVTDEIQSQCSLH